jgi:uncharacterized membrane protein YraQ (UPF0718 family)
MNVAILIMFWAMLGWQFAAAEFFGGIVIVTIVSIGLTLVFRGDALHASDTAAADAGARVTECLQCGMEGEEEHAVTYEGRTYLFCGARHEAGFRADPQGVLAAARAEDESMPGLGALRSAGTWKTVLDTFLADVEMLRGELVLGFVVAGFAAALVPPSWLSWLLRDVGSVPFVGYPLLLLVGLLLAVVTFVCSMGNVPIARFLAVAGIPLGANTTFVYGDLLIPPLVAIYRKSFPPQLVYAFLGLFVVGALVAGALVDLAFGRSFAAMHAMSSMSFSNGFTIVANVIALVALGAVIVAGRRRTSAEGRHGEAHAH